MTPWMILTFCGYGSSSRVFSILDDDPAEMIGRSSLPCWTALQLRANRENSPFWSDPPLCSSLWLNELCKTASMFARSKGRVHTAFMPAARESLGSISGSIAAISTRGIFLFLLNRACASRSRMYRTMSCCVWSLKFVSKIRQSWFHPASSSTSFSIVSFPEPARTHWCCSPWSCCRAMIARSTMRCFMSEIATRMRHDRPFGFSASCVCWLSTAGFGASEWHPGVSLRMRMTHATTASWRAERRTGRETIEQRCRSR
mmetsp:Transcript_54530/g.129504  ORF Transcript_54530/g.129504 Transcript_54530/m.129504 type:complete len:258 (+) Transcript_54530:399-1172(+)